MADTSRRADWYIVCDRCGGELWASESAREWTGLRVHRVGCLDQRHPQEFVKGRADRQKVPFTRPEPPDVFVDIGNISLSASTVSEEAEPGTVIGALAVSGVGPQVFTLEDSADGRFAISGTNLVVGLAGLDYETATSHTIRVAAMYGITRTFTITVTQDQSAVAGTFTLSGQAANLLYNRLLTAAYGSFALTGQDAALRYNRVLVAEAGTFTLSGQAAGLGRGYSMVGTFGSFVLTGQAATLTKMEAESVTLFASMSVAPDSARKVIINTLIKALKDAGVWTKMDALWVLAAHDEQAGRLNWKDPGNFTITVVNSWTFTTDRGFAGDGISGAGDTGFVVATHGVQLTQNDAHLAVYQRTGGSNGSSPFSENNGSYRLNVTGGTGTSTRGRLFSSSDLNGATGGTQPLHGMVRRNDSSNVSVVRDGSQTTAPTARTSTAPGGGNMRFGVMGNTTFVSHQVAAGHFGAYLDDTEAAAAYAALYAYMVAVGADT